MLEGAKRHTSMCQAFYLIFSIRESISFQSAALFNANFVWNRNETCGADLVRK